ncbi:hypothetical protein EMCRGX_G009154 [Ephydatia muelleri]
MNQRGSPAAERRGGGLGDGSRLVASGGRRVLIRVEVGGDPGTGGGGNQDGYDLVVSPRRQERPPRESHQPSHEPRGAPLPLSLPTVNKSDGSNVAAHKRGVAEALQGIHQREELCSLDVGTLYQLRTLINSSSYANGSTTNVSVHQQSTKFQAAFFFFALRQDSNILCSGSSRLTSGN